MNGILNSSDFDELVFASKNKEYGSYTLRKSYNRYISFAMLIAIIMVVLATAGPVIYNYLNPPSTENKTVKKVIMTELAPPPSISEEKKVEQIEAPPPLKSTIKFTPPVVKPDANVTEEYIPTVDELQDVDPGLKTETGSESGVDYSLLDVQEEVVEEKEEAPAYFIAVEEMPEPVGGISAIQAKIKYPEMAKRAGIEGKVYVLAFVDENGSVTGVKVIKGIGAGCDEAAMDAVKTTKFKPGRQRGTPVKVQVSIPIVFKLQ